MHSGTRSAGGFDNIRNKADAAAAAVDALGQSMDAAGELETSTQQTPAQHARQLANYEREQGRERRARERDARRGQRAAGPAKASKKGKEKKTKEVPRAVTMQQLRDRLLGGDLGALGENIASLASPASSVADLKPSVVIHHTDNSVTYNQDIDIKVDGAASPTATAEAVHRRLETEVRKVILADNARTARSIPNTVVRRLSSPTRPHIRRSRTAERALRRRGGRAPLGSPSRAPSHRGARA